MKHLDKKFRFNYVRHHIFPEIARLLLLALSVFTSYLTYVGGIIGIITLGTRGNLARAVADRHIQNFDPADWMVGDGHWRVYIHLRPVSIHKQNLKAICENWHCKGCSPLC